MKKRTKIIIVSFLVLILSLIAGGFLFYKSCLSPVASSKNKRTIEFEVKRGRGKKEIAEDLEEAGLIKNKYALYIYFALNKTNLQAGRYELSTDMSAEEIIDKINKGKIIEIKNTYNIRFIEGKRMPYYAEIIADNTISTKEEVLELMSNEDYLKELIDKYWFLTDEILNKDIYYPLEGYLFASTYEIYVNSDAKAIIARMLDGTSEILSRYKEEIEKSKYSVHELLALASIVEIEGAGSDDRPGIAGVIYNRLNDGWSLGMDSTTYYAARVDFSERELYQREIDDINAYNTRPAAMAGKLPVGPICSPSMESIVSAIEPENHDYYFFVADKYKKTYFTRTNSEHLNMIAKLKNEGLWYEFR